MTALGRLLSHRYGGAITRSLATLGDGVVFSSAFFLFAFLPLCILIDKALQTVKAREAQNYFLLFASLLFYSFGEGYYMIVMVVSIIGNYLFGLLISSEKNKYKGATLAVGVAFNVLILVYYKYFGFLIDNLNMLPFVNVNANPVHLPIGISFFTFQAITYIVDLYRGRFPVQRNPFHLGLYISMFPQLIAGPIVRYESIQAQILDRNPTLDDIASGLRLFCIGLLQKVIVADTMAKIVDHSVQSVAVSDFSTPMAWLWISAYSLQIFFDFAGYSIMALGLGRVFGFSFPLNFDQPYISRSIREFWRRWHISLSSWFRDYVYIPLGGSKGGEVMTYRNLLIVFLLTGVWHGASWNFVIWGLFHGAFIVLERTRSVGGVLDRMPFLLQRIYLLLVVMVGWVFFRLEEFPDALAMLKAMFIWTPVNAQTELLAHPLYYLNGWTTSVLVLGVVWALISPERGRWIADRLGRPGSPARQTALNIGACLVLAVTLMAVMSGSYTAFIYFRF